MGILYGKNDIHVMHTKKAHVYNKMLLCIHKQPVTLLYIKVLIYIENDWIHASGTILHPHEAAFSGVSRVGLRGFFSSKNRKFKWLVNVGVSIVSTP